MRSRLTMLFLCMGMLLVSWTAARSQSATGQFNGHVTDQVGSVLPGATVTLQDMATGLNRTTQSNGEGLYEFPLVQPGVYKIYYSQNSGVGYGTGFGSAGIPGSIYPFPSPGGQWNRENIYYLDGIINTAAFASTYDVPPIIDTIQEFKIQAC